MVSALDDNVGKILGALATDDLDDRTLVFFLNDNGGTASPRYAYGASNAPLRGEKRETWEGGIRVAFMVRWKGRLPEGRVDHRPVIQLDVVPTALAAAGVSVRSAWNLDGVDLLPFLAGKRSEAPHDALYWRLGGLMAIRRENWKLVRGEGNFRRSDPSVFDDLSDAGLYDLTDDVGETTDLAGSQPDKVRELADDWKRWNRSLAPPRWPPAPDD